MWIKTYSITVSDLEPSDIWKIWSDLSLRTQWDDDTEWVKSDGTFNKGSTFYFKPKDGPELQMEITECIPNQRFTDSVKFPLARLYGIHDMEKTSTGLKITTTIKIEGILSWLWGHLVGKKIVAELPHQTDLLIQLARKKS